MSYRASGSSGSFLERRFPAFVFAGAFLLLAVAAFFFAVAFFACVLALGFATFFVAAFFGAADFTPRLAFGFACLSACLAIWLLILPASHTPLHETAPTRKVFMEYVFYFG